MRVTMLDHATGKPVEGLRAVEMADHDVVAVHGYFNNILGKSGSEAQQPLSELVNSLSDGALKVSVGKLLELAKERSEDVFFIG